MRDVQCELIGRASLVPPGPALLDFPAVRGPTSYLSTWPELLKGMMAAVGAVEAWFKGGPVDGRLMPVEKTVGGQLPEVVKLPQTGVYLGASDLPATAVEGPTTRGDDGHLVDDQPSADEQLTIDLPVPTDQMVVVLLSYR